MGYLGEAIRYNHDTGNVASVTDNYKMNLPVGATVVMASNDVVLNVWDSPVLSDNKGNVYTVVVEDHTAPVTNRQFVMCTGKLTTAVTTTDSWTLTVATAKPAKWTVLALAFDDGDGYDVSTYVIGASASPNSGATTAGAQNAEIVVGGFTWTDTALATDFAAAGGSTLSGVKCSSIDRSLTMTYQYVNAAGTRSAAGTLGSGQGWLAAAVVIKKKAAVVASTMTTNTGNAAAAGNSGVFSGTIVDTPAFWYGPNGNWVPLDIVIM